MIASWGARAVARRLFVCAVLASAALVAQTGWATHIKPEPPFTGLKPAKPRESKLKPGLAVTYYLNRFNDTAELLLEAEITKGDKGKPLPQLNYKSGRGTVLTSNREDMVGAMIRGFIKFSKKGTYTLLLNSNDGVILTIAGRKLYEDPTVHSDDMSPPIKLEIGETGWYSLEIAYFEKKNTATLELFWQEPGGAGDAVPVPAQAFAHIPE